MSTRSCARLACAALLLASIGPARAEPLTLDLPHAVARAREHAPKAIAALAKRGEARARRAGAGVLFEQNPEIDVGAGPRFGDPRTLAIDSRIVQPLELGRRGARIAAADADIAHARATSAADLRVLDYEVTTAFYEARFAELAVKQAEREVEIATRADETATRRRKAGEITDLDTGLARIALGRARAALAAAKATQAAAIGRLGALVGARPEDTITLSGELRAPALSLAELAALLVDGHDGTRIPLGKLATIEQTFGLGTIKREAGSRRIAIDASVAGRDVGSTAADVRAALRAQLELPPGYFVDVGGKVETQGRAQRALYVAVGIAILAVFLLLYIALGSIAETLVILATLPDAFVGGIIALWLAGETWSVSSLVGLIGLFGIAVQNGLVLVTQTRGLVAEGRDVPAALREASLGRVRPKLMTAATAILGLLPLLVLPLHGTEIERPLAIVMTGGLITSTLFTLLALPTFYELVHRIQAPLAARRLRAKETDE